ncbi:hypothetical protein [Streptomyces sp. NBRC 110028]|uniref:hypothetical protein n=1 Tax=Streptomyces sp. NBRC 110028 TaxID=1621260 RepID=UPI000A98696B|nr:hypothetical protein [Streptomyces sp. NBRC 110028]
MEEMRNLTAPRWRTYELSNVPGVESVAYGVVQPGRHDPVGVPMVRAGDIGEGAVVGRDLARIATAVDRRHARTSLQPEDLLVVLVGRIGDTAVTGPAHQGWNVARSVAVIRFTPEGLASGIGAWIRWSLKTPQARQVLRRLSGGAEHSTLPLADLKRLPVSLPPRELRARLLRTMSLAEQRMALNDQIAGCATELADMYFARYAQNNDHAYRPEVTIADVGQVVGGSPRSGAVDGAAPIAWAAPREVLNSRTAHLDRTAEMTWVPGDAVCGPGTLLVAPRPGEVRTVISTISVVPGRGTLAVRTETTADRLWLLHELRARSRELVATAQGEQARAMSRKKFSRRRLRWPDGDVRERFSRIAAPLHDRAHAALKENHALRELVVSEMAERPNEER